MSKIPLSSTYMTANGFLLAGKASSPGIFQLKYRSCAVAPTSKVNFTFENQVKTLYLTTEFLDFGQLKIQKPGWIRLEFTGSVFCDSEIEIQPLDKKEIPIHFLSDSTEQSATSCHLWWKVPIEKAQIDAFYNEILVTDDPVNTYFAVCGFHRGYFGIQVNSQTERRILFSVWDKNRAQDSQRCQVSSDSKVCCVEKPEGCVGEDFGHEGTGFHVIKPYAWKKETKYRFLITAKPNFESKSAEISAFFSETSGGTWDLIGRMIAPNYESTFLNDFYSFVEDFRGTNGYLKRAAKFGPAWVHDANHGWMQVKQATFTHTNKKIRDDFDAKADNEGICLQTGGFEGSGPKYGATFAMGPSGIKPEDLGLVAKKCNK